MTPNSRCCGTSCHGRGESIRGRPSPHPAHRVPCLVGAGGFSCLEKVAGTENPADLLTKSHSAADTAAPLSWVGATLGRRDGSATPMGSKRTSARSKTLRATRGPGPQADLTGRGRGESLCGARQKTNMLMTPGLIFGGAFLANATNMCYVFNCFFKHCATLGGDRTAEVTTFRGRRGPGLA